MENFVTRNPQEEVFDLLHMVEQDTLPQQITHPHPALGTQAATNLPSYHPTPVAFVNQLLDLTDRLSGGRAGLIQRLVTYLFIGGSAALVNMAVFYLCFYVIPMPVNLTVHNMIASLIASEISIMANFIPNDFFTFRHLAGHERSWLARCARFHLTAIVGAILNIVIELSLTTQLHIRAIISQAIALLLVLIYNFTFHHIFTYRQVKTKTLTQNA